MDRKKVENYFFLKFLQSINGIGTQRIISLLSYYCSFDSLTKTGYGNLIEIDGISRTIAYRIISSVDNASQIKEETEYEIESLLKLGGNICTYLDLDFPEMLKNIYLPPLILYIKGNIIEEDNTSLAVVGTRQPSNYGTMIAEKISRELVQKKITIVSGLARGIDSIAHSTALQNGGRTIAVIGSGLDVIYPPENKKLFEKICSNGAVISEYGLGTKPDAQNFPRRNRIISGLSLGTVIIETKINGGAMQTAAYALDQGREVFAVPGNLNAKYSEGPNSLIQKGEAKLVTCADDMLDELKLKLSPETRVKMNAPIVQLSIFEEKVYTTLSFHPKQIDDIATECMMSTADCLVNLLTLEFKGLVKQLPGKMFIAV